MLRVNMLKHWGVIPLLVFDGAKLPSKKGTEDTRNSSREEHLKLGMAFTQQGLAKEARDHFVKAVDITPDVAYRLIDV